MTGNAGSDAGAGGGAPEVDGGKAQGSSGEVFAQNREVITTGSVSLTVGDPIRAAQDAATITEQAGGRIDSRSENPRTPNQPPTATLSLRIPAHELDNALSQLKRLGTVNFVSLKAADVTQQTRDLDARITSLGTSVDRLLGLMSQSANTADLISIESALSKRQEELESLQSQREYLSDQIDYSTITLELYGKGTVAPGAPGDFWTAIAAGWTALTTALGGAVVAFGYALPSLVALAVVALVAVLAIRLVRRTRRGPVPPSVAPDPAPEA